MVGQPIDDIWLDTSRQVYNYPTLSNWEQSLIAWKVNQTIDDTYSHNSKES